MEKIIEMLKSHQGEKSLCKFAEQIGIDKGTLSRYYTGQRTMSLIVAQRLMRYFTSAGDFDAVSALTQYAMGGLYEK